MTSVSTQLFLVLVPLLVVLPVVEAVGAGAAVALFLGVLLSITGICACPKEKWMDVTCLGVYAPKEKWMDVTWKGLLNQTLL